MSAPSLLVLASASPRRAELLARLGLPFSILPTPTREALKPGQSPERQARRLALEKALATAKRLHQRRPKAQGWVLGADTLVWLARKALEKPDSPAEAFSMLKRLSGRSHQVLTGLALVPLQGGEPLLAVESTRVFFRRLSDEEMHAYVLSGGPLDKAGGYGIQEGAGAFVRRIEGCYFNVMGLPLSRTALLLGQAGLR